MIDASLSNCHAAPPVRSATLRSRSGYACVIPLLLGIQTTALAAGSTVQESPERGRTDQDTHPKDGGRLAATTGDLVATVLGRTDDADRVRVSISWANGWRNERSHDAAWLVLKDGSGGPVRLGSDGHQVAESEPAAGVHVSEDGVGVFVMPTVTHDGAFRAVVDLTVANVPEVGALSAWAIEMVHVPGGAFELGDDHPDAIEQSSFWKVGEDGQPAGVVTVQSEAAVEVGREPGELYYEAGRNPEYRGDQKGPIPAAYPKGTRGFYVMKYELTQGQYAAFVSALPKAGRARRIQLPPEGEEAETFSVRRDGDQLVADAPGRPCNFVTWEDTCAFADWMGLRPMTEFEFEKAARGPARPVPLDYPWGTADSSTITRRVTRSRDLEGRPGGVGDRLENGGSYYGVVDLSGSVWERVVTAGHPAGRSFRGTHGDGVLDPETLRATNPDWPRSSDDQQEADGVGYRGGAEYFSEASITNPYSAVGVRTFAAWNGAFRYKTYSARMCRTEPR